MPVGRMWETPAIKPHENPIPVMAAGSVPVNGGEALFRANRRRSRSTPPFALSDAAAVASGQDRLPVLLYPLPRQKLRRLRHRGPELCPAARRPAQHPGPVHARRGAVQGDQLRHPRRAPAGPGHHRGGRTIAGRPSPSSRASASVSDAGKTSNGSAPNDN
jgi:hypothetical protein